MCAVTWLGVSRTGFFMVLVQANIVTGTNTPADPLYPDTIINIYINNLGKNFIFSHPVDRKQTFFFQCCLNPTYYCILFAVVKTTILLKEISDWPKVNDVYTQCEYWTA